MREEYGENLLINPSAQTLEGWTMEGVTRVAGGTEGSYCFRLEQSASMWQDLPEATLILKPPNFKLAIDFRIPTPPSGTEVLANLQLLLGYVGGTIDSFIVPCHPSLLPDSVLLAGGWVRAEQICPVNEGLVLREVRVSVKTEQLDGGLLVDNIQLRKDLDIWEEAYEETGWADLFRDKSILYGLDADKPVLR